MKKLLYEALKHAYKRLNDIPHKYADTDFKLIEKALNTYEKRGGK